MPLTLDDISLPVLVAGLKTLAKILDKGRAHADETGLAHTDLLNARLAPDMLTLTGQVQRATDTAKFVAVRVGGVENKPMKDEETSFADLQARIAATIAFLDGVPAGTIEKGADAEVVITPGGTRRVFTGRSYVLQFALPNFFFHVTTAYDLLRHKGVPLGKADYLGWR